MADENNNDEWALERVDSERFDANGQRWLFVKWAGRYRRT